MLVFVIGLLTSILVISPCVAESTWPNQREGDFLLTNFQFSDGEILPELRLHYTILGTAKHNGEGKIVNGVLLLHGTSGGGKNWLAPSLANELFGDSQPLDASEYFIILPDDIGRGQSSKPSDGLRAKFPHYRSRDVVEAEYRLLTEGLGVSHLHLVLGSSSGGMHTWLWGTMYPNFMDALVPIASQPTANRQP